MKPCDHVSMVMDSNYTQFRAAWRVYRDSISGDVSHSGGQFRAQNEAEVQLYWEIFKIFYKNHKYILGDTDSGLLTRNQKCEITTGAPSFHFWVNQPQSVMVY